MVVNVDVDAARLDEVFAAVFTKPAKPGDRIRAVLTCASKSPRAPEQGEVRWDVQVLD